jgi:hypothetical protein
MSHGHETMPTSFQGVGIKARKNAVESNLFLSPSISSISIIG